MSDQSNDIFRDGRNILKSLSQRDFLLFGVNQIAYIKPITVKNSDGTKYGFALHGADGAALAVVDSAELAAVTARQNDMDAVQLH